MKQWAVSMGPSEAGYLIRPGAGLGQALRGLIGFSCPKRSLSQNEVDHGNI